MNDRARKVIGCAPDPYFLSREMNTSKTKMDRALFHGALTDAICIKNDPLSRRSFSIFRRRREISEIKANGDTSAAGGGGGRDSDNVSTDFD